MLKIKDNVDLKELEKFGFEYDVDYNKYKYNWADDFTFGIIIKDREIIVGYDNMLDSPIPEKLYDLIKADMVEKVEV